MAVLLNDSPVQKPEYEGTRKSSLSKSTAVPEFRTTIICPIYRVAFKSEVIQLLQL